MKSESLIRRELKKAKELQNYYAKTRYGEYEHVSFGEQVATLEWVLSDTKKEKKK